MQILINLHLVNHTQRCQNVNTSSWYARSFECFVILFDCAPIMIVLNVDCECRRLEF